MVLFCSWRILVIPSTLKDFLEQLVSIRQLCSVPLAAQILCWVLLGGTLREGEHFLHVEPHLRAIRIARC